jgi:hypothetical protein
VVALGGYDGFLGRVSGSNRVHRRGIGRSYIEVRGRGVLVLKTYNCDGHSGSYTWPKDKEFIWRAPICGCTEWFQHNGNVTEDGIELVWAHRTDGPAVMWDSGLIKWWVRGEEMRTWNQFQEASACSDIEIILFKLKYGDIE